MQPTNPQMPEDWQQPQEVGPQAPYQVVEDQYAEDQPPTEALPEEVGIDAADGFIPDNGHDALIRWEGTEYPHHDRTLGWYGVLCVITVVLMALALLLMRSLTFALLLPVMAATLVLYTRRAPAINTYTLSRKGLYVDEKLYGYHQFKSFSVVSHNGVHAVVLAPRKRFQIGQTVYFPEDVGEQLVDMLAARLPMREGSLDVIDRLLARLHL
jgi:hypothetical protein